MKRLLYLLVINQFLNFVLSNYMYIEPADQLKGGTLIKKGQYPYFVQIAIGTAIEQNKEGGEVRGYGCAGSLIHPFWILTAAHCFKKVKLSTVFFESNYIIALMGSEEANFTRAGLVRFVQKAYIHPYYEYEKMVFDLDVQYNVAVAVLKKPFLINEFVQTIRLPDSTTSLCESGTVIGRRRTNSGTYTRLEAYNQVRTRTLNDVSDTPTFHSRGVFFSEIKWYKGRPLVGDEGAPFVCFQEYEPIQYGIVSTFYNSTENQTIITVYENVKRHMKFIKRWVPLKPTYKILKLYFK